MKSFTNKLCQQSKYQKGKVLCAENFFSLNVCTRKVSNEKACTNKRSQKKYSQTCECCELATKREEKKRLNAHQNKWKLLWIYERKPN